jgi:light-regulated signal transduction histidine kinase (bacteriophytochrome)
MSRFGNVLGGLFFGHEKAGVFTEQHERIVKGIANQAAIALDNATLFAASKRNEEELKRAIAGLRRANADLEQFAYSASHDLQEPIRNIAIYGEILSRRYGRLLDENGKECLEFITAGAHRMEMLLRDLLAYAHSTQVEDDAIKEGDAEEALKKALSNLSAVISSTGAKIVSNKLPIVQVHEIQLQQLFQNLIGNAIKYRRFGVPPEIRVTAEPDGASQWRFSIRDNGIGIAPEYKERVFGIFKRLHGREQYSGTGIGLAICQKIAEQNGGRIWMASEGLGKGSTFHFTLPMVPDR